MQGLVKTLLILREWSSSDTITSTWGYEVRGSGSLRHSVIGQDLQFLGGLPNDWSNQNAHIFWYPGKSFVNFVSYEPGKYKLQPYELCFHCHVSDSQKVTVCGIADPPEAVRIIYNRIPGTLGRWLDKRIIDFRTDLPFALTAAERRIRTNRYNGCETNHQVY